MWLRIAIETSKGTIRPKRPWISGTGARSGCARVYAGMRTFISVMPWTKFE